MDKAVELILEAVAEGCHIRVIGDYDVDGICSSYILTKGLQLVGAKADTAIPHRIHDTGLIPNSSAHLLKSALFAATYHFSIRTLRCRSSRTAFYPLNQPHQLTVFNSCAPEIGKRDLLHLTDDTGIHRPMPDDQNALSRRKLRLHHLF